MKKQPIVGKQLDLLEGCSQSLSCSLSFFTNVMSFVSLFYYRSSQWDWV